MGMKVSDGEEGQYGCKVDYTEQISKCTEGNDSQDSSTHTFVYVREMRL